MSVFWHRLRAGMTASGHFRHRQNVCYRSRPEARCPKSRRDGLLAQFNRDGWSYDRPFSVNPWV